MLTLKRFAAPLAALALPVLLATSALAQTAASKPAMSGGKMMGSKMSVKGLVPVSGTMPSKSQMMGAKVVSTMMMNGKACYTVRLKSGKTVQMCKPMDKKMMMGGKMHGGKMSGGSKMSGGKMGGKM
jgi:hypothetical protein